MTSTTFATPFGRQDGLTDASMEYRGLLQASTLSPDNIASDAAAMDPFSITIGCISLHDAVNNSITRITDFANSFLDERPELIRVHKLYKQLKGVLEQQLHHDRNNRTASSNDVPVDEDDNDHFKDQINYLLDLLDALDLLFSLYRGSWAARWEVNGKPTTKHFARMLKNHIDWLQLNVNIKTFDLWFLEDDEPNTTSEERDPGFPVNSVSRHFTGHLASLGKPPQRPASPRGWLENERELPPFDDEREYRAAPRISRLDTQLPLLDNAESVFIGSAQPSFFDNAAAISIPSLSGVGWIYPVVTYTYSSAAAGNISGSPQSPDNDWCWVQTSHEPSYYATFAPQTPAGPSHATLPGQNLSTPPSGLDTPKPKPISPADEKIREDFKQKIWASVGKVPGKKGGNPVAAARTTAVSTAINPDVRMQRA